MKKTYYSVVYRNWGADRPGRAWFDTKKAAEDFANHDYRDNVIAHHVSKTKTIKEYDELVARTNINIKGYYFNHESDRKSTVY